MLEVPQYQTSKLCYRVIVIKTALYCHNTDTQTRKIGDPEINQHSYRRLIFDKGSKICIREKADSLTNGVVITGSVHVEDWHWIPSSYPAQKSIKKWVNIINVRFENLKLLWKKHKENT